MKKLDIIEDLEKTVRHLRARIMGGENVAVVMEKTCANGAKVIVRDDCYRDATPEEIERRHQAIWRAMCMIARHNAEAPHPSAPAALPPSPKGEGKNAPAAREAVGA